MKTIVAGGRTFNDYAKMVKQLDSLPWEITEIVSGTARGADRLGEQFARENDIPVTRMPANWDQHGKSAGFIRNEEMAKYADACVCFWDQSTERSGTYHMINSALKYGLRLTVVHYTPVKETL